MRSATRSSFTVFAVLILAIVLTAPFSAIAASTTSDTITPHTELTPKGQVKRQYFVYTKQGAKHAVLIEHGLDLPTFTDSQSYESDVERFRRDAYGLKMLELGVSHGIIKNVPNDLKGDKFREWMRNEAVKVENSLCSNSALRKDILSLFKNAIEVPPPPENEELDSIAVPPDAKSAPKRQGTTL